MLAIVDADDYRRYSESLSSRCFCRGFCTTSWLAMERSLAHPAASGSLVILAIADGEAQNWKLGGLGSE